MSNIPPVSVRQPYRLYQFSSMTDNQVRQFSNLLFLSAPSLFNYMFGEGKAEDFLQRACAQYDGQFGYGNHIFCVQDAQSKIHPLQKREIHHDVYGSHERDVADKVEFPADEMEQAEGVSLENTDKAITSDKVINSIVDYQNKESQSQESLKIVGCVTIWSNTPTADFIFHTIKALKDQLDAEQLAKCFELNKDLDRVFITPTENELCLGHLSVRSELKRLGIASALVKQVETTALYKGKKSILLDVESTNHPAIACYEKLGFTQQHRSYLKQTNTRFIRMRKRVINEPTRPD